MASNDFVVPDWPAPPNVHAAVTTRLQPGRSAGPFGAFNLGTRNGDDWIAVAANRADLRRRLALPASPHWLHQVHSTTVFDADAQQDTGDEPQADAAVARGADVVLAVLTADCLPILLCSDDGAAIAVAHAGWRGLAAGVIEATLARMGGDAAHVLAWLGPAIGPASYEVGEDVRAAFVAADAQASDAFAATREGHWHCDLVRLARQRLAKSGVGRVFGGGFDTFADARFYSYRRENCTGRFATLIWRQG